jgi:hypothetical protein
MRVWSAVATMLTVAASLAAAPAYAQTCDQLWVERNQYYRIHGYCFKTERAISFFGNAGCYIQEEGAVPLTPAERARIDQIVQQERAMGCSSAGPSTGLTCDQLWIARNSMYKARGYCFKTQRAIAYFTNIGCIYQNEGDIPFTQAERNQIEQYVQQERAIGCQ